MIIGAVNNFTTNTNVQTVYGSSTVKRAWSQARLRVHLVLLKSLNSGTMSTHSVPSRKTPRGSVQQREMRHESRQPTHTDTRVD